MDANAAQEAAKFADGGAGARCWASAGSRALLQAADVQRVFVRGNAELQGLDRRRVTVNSHGAVVKRADAALKDTKIAGGGSWAHRWAGAGLLAGGADSGRGKSMCPSARDRRVGGRRKASRQGVRPEATEIADGGAWARCQAGTG